jgi:hypothetical protein
MPTFQIKCGTVEGIETASNAGVAFRRLIRKTTNSDLFAELARFREVKVTGKAVQRIHPQGPWFYQEPLALEESGHRCSWRANRPRVARLKRI